MQEWLWWVPCWSLEWAFTTHVTIIFTSNLFDMITELSSLIVGLVSIADITRLSQKLPLGYSDTEAGSTGEEAISSSHWWCTTVCSRTASSEQRHLMFPRTGPLTVNSASWLLLKWLWHQLSSPCWNAPSCTVVSLICSVRFGLLNLILPGKESVLFSTLTKGTIQNFNLIWHRCWLLFCGIHWFSHCSASSPEVCYLWERSNIVHGLRKQTPALSRLGAQFKLKVAWMRATPAALFIISALMGVIHNFNLIWHQNA